MVHRWHDRLHVYLHALDGKHILAISWFAEACVTGSCTCEFMLLQSM